MAQAKTKVIFDRELGQYVLVPDTSGAEAPARFDEPINELLPREPGYDYSEGLGLVPLRQKAIPYAPGKGPKELALPGAARTILNDLYLLGTGPGRAVSGEFSENELAEAGIRAGGALGWGSYGFARPRNALGAGGGFFGKKPPAVSEGIPKQPAALKEQYNELNQAKAAVEAHTKPLNMQVKIDPVSGEYHIFGQSGANLSTYAGPKLKSKLDNLNEKHLAYQGAVKEVGSFADDPLAKFNQAYSEVQKEIEETGNWKLGVNKEGEFDIFTHDAEGNTNPNYSYVKNASGYIKENLDKLKAAHKEYVESVSAPPKSEISEESAFHPKNFAEQKEEVSPHLAEFQKTYGEVESELKKWSPGYKIEGPDAYGGYGISNYGKEIEYHPDSVVGEQMKKLNEAAEKHDEAVVLEETGKVLPKKNKPSVATPHPAQKIFDEAYGKAKPGTFTKGDVGNAVADWESVFKITPKAHVFPQEHTSHKIESSEGNFSMNSYPNEGKVSLLAPNESVYHFDSPNKAFEFIDEWNQYGAPPSTSDYGATISSKKTSPFAKAPGLDEMTPEQMREYSPAELDWEYNNEYLKYTKHLFPDAFKDKADFQRQYEAAPLTTLSKDELQNLEYATVGGLLGKEPEADKIAKVMDVAGHRRDVPGIMEGIRSGQTAPPIVLKHDDGMRILGGNTRLMSALALGKNMPVKIIDIRSFPRKDTDVFDLHPPLTPEKRAGNFRKFFEGSKVVDEQGDPLIMYHSSPHRNITYLDPEKSKQEGKFVSLTSSPPFANEWKDPRNATIYPVYVYAEKPGDFRNPEHVHDAAVWKTREEIEHTSATRKEKDEMLDIGHQQAMSKFPYYTRTYEDQVQRAESGVWTFWENPTMWKALGWDGAWMNENGGGVSDALNISVPKATQIKSVFNKGYWDPNDPRMLYSAGAPLPLGLEPVEHDPFALEPVSGNPFEQESME